MAREAGIDHVYRLMKKYDINPPAKGGGFGSRGARRLDRPAAGPVLPRHLLERPAVAEAVVQQVTGRRTAAPAPARARAADDCGDEHAVGAHQRLRSLRLPLHVAGHPAGPATHAAAHRWRPTGLAPRRSTPRTSSCCAHPEHRRPPRGPRRSPGCR
ncbi:MAG: hypothetical protein R3F43_09705 [bacterium]